MIFFFLFKFLQYFNQKYQNNLQMPKEESYFIERLYDAIEQHRSSVVDWDPAGKGFIVGNLQQFTNQVLIKKFNIGRLDSFARKLNRHGFKRSKIDKYKIRFFHKYFSRQSKNIGLIKKLSKLESLPKHIKLRMIRQQRQQLTNKNLKSPIRQLDIVSQIFETTKIKQNEQKKSEKQIQAHSHNPNMNVNINSNSNTNPSQYYQKCSEFLNYEAQNQLCQQLQAPFHPNFEPKQYYGNYSNLFHSPNKQLLKNNEQLYPYKFKTKINLNLDEEEELQRFGDDQSNEFDSFERQKYIEQDDQRYYYGENKGVHHQCQYSCSCESPKIVQKNNRNKSNSKTQAQPTSQTKRKKSIKKNPRTEQKSSKKKLITN